LYLRTKTDEEDCPFFPIKYCDHAPARPIPPTMREDDQSVLIYLYCNGGSIVVRRQDEGLRHGKRMVDISRESLELNRVTKDPISASEYGAFN
jgi:hypothetical protein